MPTKPISPKSPKVLLIEEHYANIKGQLTWDSDRLDRLCTAAQLTHEELAAIIRYPGFRLLEAAARNRFPPTVELHLSLIENWVFRQIGQRQILPNIF